jgi:eukaryotic-like serine/threonine-protein kinase
MVHAQVETVSQLCDLLVRSQLVPLDEVQRLQAEYCRQDAHESLDEFITILVKRGLLTEWQISKLREQKYKGFFLSHYRLLRRLSYEVDGARYLARDERSGGEVVIRVRPPQLTWSWGIEGEDWNIEPISG